MSAPGTRDACVDVAALLRPEAYPHPVQEPIRLAETHVSWVVLTGEYAYKLKKPLRLSFLDYSTLERRRALCAEEVRLNARHAPGLYLGVSTIGGSPDAPRVDGAGPALEYAVRMRQFAASEELGALLASGSATGEDLAGLGAAIARLHALAWPAAAGTAHGDPDDVHRITRENFAELRRLPGAEQAPGRLEALERRLDALHARLAPRMRERRAGGWIRECHGDLHCGNVVRWRGQLTPFDGIEFDPALRFIDVVNDVAFLSMDLAERGHADLRLAALQAWLETLGDCTGLPLLPYYEACRALVRAKVAALRAVQPRATGPARDAALAECRRYLAWSSERLDAGRPRLLVTCGLSGSGKTWLAQRLRAPLGALHLRSDVERKRLAGLAPGADSRSPPDGGIYAPEFTARTYARLLECARAALEGGESLIVDAACLRRAERLQFVNLAQARGARVAIVRCHAPDAVLRERVAARLAARNDASEAGLDVLRRQPSWWEPFDDRERPLVVEIDTSADGPVERVRAALERLPG
jgi:uncharacterized protein